MSAVWAEPYSAGGVAGPLTWGFAMAACCARKSASLVETREKWFDEYLRDSVTDG